jgi:tetratricopeptide (TPR) repeat protein
MPGNNWCQGSSGASDCKQEYASPLRDIIFILITLATFTLAAFAQTDSDSFTVHFRKGQQAAALKHYEQAVVEFREALRIDANSTEARANLGLMYYLSGKYDAAIIELNRVAQISANLLPAQLFLGISYLKAGHPERALGPLKRAIEIDPGNPEALRALFTCQLGLEDYQNATRTLRAISRSGDPSDGHYQAAHGYFEMAARLTEMLAQNDRTSGWAHRLAADLAADRRAWTEAIDEYRKAITANPAMPEVRASLASALREAGKPEEAEAQTVLGKPTKSADAGDKPGTGRALFAANRPAEAADVFASALQKGDTGAEVKYYLIRIYTLMAADNFTFLINSTPESGRTHELRADLAALRRDFPNAEAEYDIAARQLPEDIEIREKLGEAEMESGRMDAARSDLERALKLSDGNGRAHFMLGRVLLARDETEAAIAELKTAVRYSPNLLQARALLGNAYIRVNKPALAIPELKRALKLDYYGDLHFLLYKACLATGDTELAREALSVSKAMRKKTVNADAAKLGIEAADSTSGTDLESKTGPAK